MIRQFPLSSPVQRAAAACGGFLALALGCVSAGAVAEQSAAGVDAVLIMDSSGSMAKNDPNKLRVPAAKMFMSLLGANDRIGLISFSDNGYPVLHLTAPGADNSKRILAAADKVSSKGVYTNLHAALDKGIEMLVKEGRQGQQQMLVLMSDGKMDVGNSDEDQQLGDSLRTDLLESARDKGIKVFTIAFTEASDTELLKEIAQGSDALFKLARSDSDLHGVFGAIFETAKQPDMLPIEGNAFVVDASIDEITIVASKEREDVRIYLAAPGGKQLSSDDAGKDVKWFLAQNFDMITLHDPEPGDWKLISTDGRNRAYIVTNMALEHNAVKPNLLTSEEMVLEAWLEQDESLLDKEAVLTNTRFEMQIEDPSGATARFELFDQGEYGDRKAADGIYTNTVGFVNPGPYKLSIVAGSATFQRQKSLHFQVDAPLVDPAAVAAPVTEPAAPETPQPEPEAVPEPQVEPEPEPEIATAPEAEAEPEPVAQVVEPEEQDFNLGLALGLFVAINLLLGGIGFGIWWLVKKRKQAAVAASEESDGE